MGDGPVADSGHGRNAQSLAFRHPADDTTLTMPVLSSGVFWYSLAGGRTLAKVRDAAGHANVSITSTYLHVVVDNEEEVGNLFGIALQQSKG